MKKPNPITSPTVSDSAQTSSSLLAFTVKAFFLLALIIPTTVYLVAARRADDFSGPDCKKNTQYYSARLLAAMQTFESGILPASAPLPTESWTDQTLLAGVPACRKDWDDSPGNFVRRWNEVRNKILFWMPPQKLRTETTAQRMAAQLNALDTYLEAVGKANDGRAEGALGLDRSRWFEAIAAALDKPTSIENQCKKPGSENNPSQAQLKLQVRCDDIRDALRTFVSSSCRQDWEAVRVNGVTPERIEQARKSCIALENLSWRGVTPKNQNAIWNSKMVHATPRLITQRDPWQGVPGCIYWNNGQSSGGHYYLADSRGRPNTICERPDVAGWVVQTSPGTQPLTASPVANQLDVKAPLNDPRWSAPPSLHTILGPLDTLRQPSGTYYLKYTEEEATSTDVPPELYRFGLNQIKVGDTEQNIGFSVDLTIVPRVQSIAQQVATCYTGIQEVCQALGITRPEDGKNKEGKPQAVGHLLLENAMVRMAGIAVIDIQSGHIEALAGALSPCTRQDYDGPGRDPKQCDDRLPWEPVFRPDVIANPALFLDAMPASTIKPIMAAAFLSDGAYGQELIATELIAVRGKIDAAAQKNEEARQKKEEAEQEGIDAKQERANTEQEKASAEQEVKVAQQEYDRILKENRATKKKATAQQKQQLAIAKNQLAQAKKRVADTNKKIGTTLKKMAKAQSKVEAHSKPVAAQNIPPSSGLRLELMTSNSPAFLDRMFCKKEGFINCTRPWLVQMMAHTFGWNSACDPATAACGKYDVLFGRTLDQVAKDGLVIPLSHPILFGRLMTQKNEGEGYGRFGLIPKQLLKADTLINCEQNRWGKCPIEIVSEGWGQGNARASVVGVAGMMAVLGGAANGSKEISPPFLVTDVRGVGDPEKATLKLALQRYGFKRVQPISLNQEIAQVILDGLNYTHRGGGTASLACEQVFNKATTCNNIDWIAGKTGTPSFNRDDSTLEKIAKDCKKGTARAKYSEDCGGLRPYKWYTAVFRSSPEKTQWDKAIAVLVERNWIRNDIKATKKVIDRNGKTREIDISGRVHGAGDHGPNPAAEIALHIIGRLRGDVGK